MLASTALIGLGILPATWATAEAADAKWCGPAGGGAKNWNAGANWCGGAAPDTKATFDGASYNSDVFIDSAVKIKAVDYLTSNYMLDIRAGGSLEVTGVVRRLPATDMTAMTFKNAGAMVLKDKGALLGPFVIANTGSMSFYDNATAGFSTINNDGTVTLYNLGTTETATINNNAGGVLQYRDGATAGAAKITNLGKIEYFNSANSGEAKFTNSGEIIFHGSAADEKRATAGTAVFTNTATGTLDMYGFSTASRAIIDNSNVVTFHDDVSAEFATITNKKTFNFTDHSSGANATITNTATGTITFDVQAAGGNATITNNGAVVFTDLGNLGDAKLTNNKTVEFLLTSNAGGGTITNAAAGTVSFKNNSSGANVNLQNAGTLLFADHATGANASLVNTATGKFDISGLIAGNTQMGSIAGEGTVFLGDRALIVGTNNKSTAFSGIFQDGGVNGGVGGALVKNGSGELSLSNTHTFTGSTDINAGILRVNGSLESSSVVNVNDGGTLAGNGKFGNVIVHDGGKIDPGNSVGTIHVRGNFTMNAGSIYWAEVNGDASDLIIVDGVANIMSETIVIVRDPDSNVPVLPGKTYTLITAAGGLNVSPNPISGYADMPFLNLVFSTDANNGYMTTSRNDAPFASLATTANEKAVANALDTAGVASPLWQQVVGGGEDEASAAFTSLSHASIHASAAGVLSAQSHHLRDAVTGRLRQDFAFGTSLDVSLAPASNALAYAPDARNAHARAPFYKAPPPMAAMVPDQVYAVWAQGLGSWGKLDGNANAASVDHSLGGVMSGIDVTFNGTWRVGLAGGYSHSTFKSPDIAASGASENYHIALYGGGQLGAWGLRGGASFSWHDVSTSRGVVVGALAGGVRGEYTASTTQVFGEIGHTIALGRSAIEPFVNLAYVHVDGGTIREHGVAAMTGSSKLDTTYTTLGVRGSVALSETLTARGTLGWRHAFGDITPVAALAFAAGGSPFSLAGAPIARDAFVAEAGLSLAVARNASLGVSYSGQFADHAHDHTVKGNFSWRF